MTHSSPSISTLKIQTHLTVGWPTIPEDHWSKDFLRVEKQTEGSLNKNSKYQKRILSLLKDKDNPYQFEEVDALFRKSTPGFQPIKRFIATLLSLETQPLKQSIVECHIDAFAYGFLKGAKNFDLLMPYHPKPDDLLHQKYQDWSTQIAQLETYERTGQPIDPALADQYKALRPILARPSNRDELRTLASLLISGPSSLEMIKNDLGLNFDLGQRTLSVFEPCGVVERRDNGLYAINTSALPLVIFGLREVLGLDLLSSLI